MPSGHPQAAEHRALILAAGVGRRLGDDLPDHRDKPKATLRFGGESLICRHVAELRRVGIRRITVVAGFAADALRAELATLGGGCPVDFVINPDYRDGSVVSLWYGQDVLRSGANVILMDADVLYDGRLMRRLVTSPYRNCLLLDRAIEPGDEPVKICIRDGRIVDFRKKPTEAYDWDGESVGFFRFDPDVAAELADRAEDYLAAGRRAVEYEEPIRDMMMASDGERFGFEDISGLPWTEIDFADDVAKARALVSELTA